MIWPFNTWAAAVRFTERMRRQGHKATFYYNDGLWRVFVR